MTATKRVHAVEEYTCVPHGEQHHVDPGMPTPMQVQHNASNKKLPQYHMSKAPDNRSPDDQPTSLCGATGRYHRPATSPSQWDQAHTVGTVNRHTR